MVTRKPRRYRSHIAIAVAVQFLILISLQSCTWREGVEKRAVGNSACTRVFLQAAEWTDRARLTGNSTLPLIADVTLDAGIDSNSSFRHALTGSTGRGSYIADFGVLDLPLVGELRARAGLRYSRLFPRGALELGFRKQIRCDSQGYELFLGLQSAGDDNRLDVLADVGARKQFKGASAFYRFLWGVGWPFDKKGRGPSWHEMGSSLGVSQKDLPPNGRGELTVGWRAGFFDNGLEGILLRAGRPSAPPSKGQERHGLLDSTPYACYRIALRVAGGALDRASVSSTLLPEHDTLEHTLRVLLSEDANGGAATLTASLAQSISCPRRLRLRVGASYVRG